MIFMIDLDLCTACYESFMDVMIFIFIRLGLLNFQIDLDLLNTSLNTFKIKMKRLFME